MASLLLQQRRPLGVCLLLLGAAGVFVTYLHPHDLGADLGGALVVDLALPEGNTEGTDAIEGALKAIAPDATFRWENELGKQTRPCSA